MHYSNVQVHRKIWKFQEKIRLQRLKLVDTTKCWFPTLNLLIKTKFRLLGPKNSVFYYHLDDSSTFFSCTFESFLSRLVNM